MITTSQIQKLGSRKAVDRFLTSRYDNDIEKFLNELDSHMNHLIRTDLKEASRLVSAVEPLFEYFPKRYKPRLLAMKGRYCNWTGDYTSALKFYKRALVLFEKVGDKKAVARTGKGLMDVNMYLGRYDVALEIGRKSLRYYRRRGMLDDCGQVLTNIGNIYHRMDKNRMALRYYEKARAIFQKTGGIPLAITDLAMISIRSGLNLRDSEKVKTVDELSRHLISRVPVPDVCNNSKGSKLVSLKRLTKAKNKTSPGATKLKSLKKLTKGNQ